MRILKLIREGAEVEPTNHNVKGIMEYLKKGDKTIDAPLGEDMVKGATHRYVVPPKNSDVKENITNKYEENDYSNLSMNDIKLLLRTEGINFSSEDSKENLLNLIQKHIEEPRKKEFDKKQKEIEKKESSKTEDTSNNEVKKTTIKKPPTSNSKTTANNKKPSTSNSKKDTTKKSVVKKEDNKKEKK
jgi:hypothetical protein